ncbi:hypothetical protein ACFX2I_047284 [Malus domestica]
MEKHQRRFWTKKERASTHPGPTQIRKTASLLNTEMGFGSEMMKVSGVSAGFDRYGSRGSDGGSGFPLKSLGDRNFWPSDFRTKSTASRCRRTQPPLSTVVSVRLPEKNKRMRRPTTSLHSTSVVITPSSTSSPHPPRPFCLLRFLQLRCLRFRLDRHSSAEI